MLTDEEILELQDKNTTLEARNIWLTDTNKKIIVMIKNAADILNAYSEGLKDIQVQIEVTQQIYSRLHNDLTEAFDENKTDRSGS